MLDKKSYKILKKIYRSNAVTYSDFSRLSNHYEANTLDKYATMLSACRFIQPWREKEPYTTENGEMIFDGYEITLEGRAYVEQHRRDKRNFWIPYSITTFIALLSLAGTIADNWGVIRCWIASLLGS